jgi:site-specific DNA-methyltransferase (adenine-specific)
VEAGVLTYRILTGDMIDQLQTLDAESVHCCVTSPPYWGLRDYGTEGQLGLEKTPELFLERMVAVFREVRRVLRDDGTCWVNMGDSYYAAGWECKRRNQVGAGSMAPESRRS